MSFLACFSHNAKFDEKVLISAGTIAKWGSIMLLFSFSTVFKHSSFSLQTVCYNTIIFSISWQVLLYPQLVKIKSSEV